MIDSFLGFIRTKRLFSDHDRVLLALSGGIDSMVMLDLFLKTGFQVGIIHCNFSLRGSESDGDEKFLGGIAKKNNIGFHVRKFNTKEYAAGQKISIQMAARDLRYAFFEEIRKEKGYKVIAMAHHLNDSAETLLFNITRGTGISGLKGISARSGNVVRPLLFTTREKIEEYAGQNKIRWREDSSNRSLKYGRNLIRHKVIPVLLKLNPNFYHTIKRTLERAESAESFIEKWIGENRKDLLQEKNKTLYINLKYLQRYGEPVLLHFLIRDFGFSYDQAANIFQVAGNQPGAQFYSATHLLTVDRQELVISIRTQQDTKFWTVERNQNLLDTGTGDRFIFTVIPKPGDLKTPRKTAYLDLNALKFPLVIRTARVGDRFQPLGMTGKQKLSDFMINNKIPRNLKSRIKLLVSGNEIAWVAGYRISERFKVGKGSRKILKVEYEE